MSKKGKKSLGKSEENASKYPYLEYEKSDYWKIIDNAIDDLVENQDLIENTTRRYIVGYLVKKIITSGK